MLCPYKNISRPNFELSESNSAQKHVRKLGFYQVDEVKVDNQ